MWLDGWFGKHGPDDTNAPQEDKLTLTRDKDGTLRPDNSGPGKGNRGEDMMLGSNPNSKPGAPPKPPSSKSPTPDVSALNSQVVQAVQFANTENSNYASELVATPPDIMVSTTTGLAVQDAKNYMNAIMQIAVAAQAVAIKKAAEGPEPVAALKEIPLLAEIQNMVTQAVGVYGSVSTAAGTSSKTVIGDLKSG
ncbi:hypothetical protein [uncultured Roseibium sp.]|uniref:hypothetical protein n=1 Tax=uncultured Roseibium sp. TaxID=1936171 RepID=UPI002598AADC|nr:hypothetical protein [uncultured Roseibium sp.]